MHKLLHYLFGWDYVYHKGYHPMVCRLHRLPTGEVFYWHYTTIEKVTKASDVEWLTCIPEQWGFTSETP